MASTLCPFVCLKSPGNLPQVMLTRYLPGKHLVGHVGAAGAQMQKSQCVGTGTVYIKTSYDTNNVQRGGASGLQKTRTISDGETKGGSGCNYPKSSTWCYWAQVQGSKCVGNT